MMELDLPIGVYRFDFATDSALAGQHWRTFSGSDWRSQIGRVLYQSCCVQPPGTDCWTCEHLSSCDYGSLFRTPRPPHASRKRTAAGISGPFAIYSGGFQQGRICLEIALFGTGNGLLGPIVSALVSLGYHGLELRHMRAELELLGVSQLDWERGQYVSILTVDGLEPLAPLSPPVPESPGSVRVELQSPYQIDKTNNDPRRFTLHRFVTHLVNRIEDLRDFYHPLGEASLERERLAKAAPVEISRRNLSRYRRSRYSRTLRGRVPLDGVTGWFDVSGPGLKTLWPYLCLGQWTQIGRKTSHGFGAYRLAPPD